MTSEYDPRRDPRRYIVSTKEEERKCACYYAEERRRLEQSKSRAYNGKPLRKLRVRQPSVGILRVGDVGWIGADGSIACSLGCVVTKVAA